MGPAPHLGLSLRSMETVGLGILCASPLETKTGKKVFVGLLLLRQGIIEDRWSSVLLFNAATSNTALSQLIQ